MTTWLDRLTARVEPDEDGIIYILGPDFDEWPEFDFTQDRLCYADRDVLYVMSLSTMLHTATVTLETWPHDPGRDSHVAWQEHEETELWLSQGQVHFSAASEHPLSENLTLGAPGRYHARVHAQGRAHLLHLERDVRISPDEMPDDTERFLVQFWPHTAPRR